MPRLETPQQTEKNWTELIIKTVNPVSLNFRIEHTLFGWGSICFNSYIRFYSILSVLSYSVLSVAMRPSAACYSFQFFVKNKLLQFSIRFNSIKPNGFFQKNTNHPIQFEAIRINGHSIFYTSEFVSFWEC